MTELSSVSGLRGVREALAELFELVESGELVRDISRDGESDWLRRAAKMTLTLKKAQLALSLPPSPQAPDNRDFKRPEGLYLKFSEPLMEPNTPVIIERVNGDCAVSQFIIARDEAYELIDQLRELLASPAGAQGQVQGVQARPPMSIGKNAAGEMHLSASGYCSTCNMLVEFGTDDCPHAKTMYGRAVSSANVSSQAGQPPSEEDTECAARDCGFQCTLDKNHAGPHKAHGFERVVHEWAAAPSAGSGQEGLRETLRDIRCVADTLYMNLKSAAIWNPDSFHKESLEQLFQRFKDAITRVVKLEAALLPPAPKSAPPATVTLNPQQYLDLALRIQRIGSEHPYRLENVGANQGMWICQCGEVLGDQPIDEIDAVASQHICKVVAELLRRASLESESK